MPNGNSRYTEWHNDDSHGWFKKHPPHPHTWVEKEEVPSDIGTLRYMMERELDKERRRLSNALSAIPRLVAEAKAMTVEEVSAKTELSVAEILLDNWDNVLQLAVANERLKGEVERLLKQVEQMSSAIYNAVESAIRPLRDDRIHDNPPPSDI
jgi:hypothetical protein